MARVLPRPVTGTPRKYRFDGATETEARRMYHQWLAMYLKRDTAKPTRNSKPVKDVSLGIECDVVPGNLVHVASSWLRHEESRVRHEGEARGRGKISLAVYRDRKKQLRDFLEFLNDKHGDDAVGRMKLADLDMGDVEGFNRHVTELDYSASQVNKRMQIVKALLDRAGRPEYGQQKLGWNWDSRDISHGKPTTARNLPTLSRLKAMVKAADLRGRTLIWMGIGLGFGQRDLSVIRAGQIDRQN